MQNEDERDIEIKRLEKLVYVPGVLMCAKCKFQQVSINLHVNTGQRSANNSPQQCPNGCGPLWRVTERDAGNEMVDRCEALQAQLDAERQHSAKLLAGYPDGMTPSDVEHLYRANAGLADENHKLQAQLKEAETEAEVNHKLIVRQSDLLTRAVNAIKGEPPELAKWSHHDVPELTREVVAQLEASRAQCGEDGQLPLQPIIDSRFRANSVVQFLLDNGPHDMNTLACEEFDDADREQFAQLIGYSVGGFSELSYVSDETYARADLIDTRLRQQEKEKSE